MKIQINKRQTTTTHTHTHTINAMYILLLVLLSFCFYHEWWIKMNILQQARKMAESIIWILSYMVVNFRDMSLTVIPLCLADQDRYTIHNKNNSGFTRRQYISVSLFVCSTLRLFVCLSVVRLKRSGRHHWCLICFLHCEKFPPVKTPSWNLW